MKSMTGFGAASCELEDFSIDIEMKSVNNRYLDINFSMPNYLNFMAEDIKTLIKTKIKRGRLDVYVKIKKYKQKVDNVDINIELATKLKEKLQYMKEYLEINSEITINDIAKYDDILTFSYEDFDNEILNKRVIEVLNESLRNIYNMRLVEGDNLRKDLLENISKIQVELDKISEISKNSVENYRENLFERILSVVDNNKIDKDRMYLEVSIMADKSDINEELTRFNSHINQFLSAIELDEPVGRRLDFIIQEMNREINTISSKSSEEAITISVIEIKSLIEKLREQVQNIE